MSGDVAFFVGIHQPSDAHRFERACISVNRLRGRKKPLGQVQVLVDSGAFTELNLYGQYRHDVDTYADELQRLHVSGVVSIAAAVAQDYMCEAFMLAKTGMIATINASPSSDTMPWSQLCKAALAAIAHFQFYQSYKDITPPIIFGTSKPTAPASLPACGSASAPSANATARRKASSTSSQP